MRKYHILIFVFLVFSISSFAQKDSVITKKFGIDKGAIILNAGIAYSAISLTQGNISIGPGDANPVNIISVSPAYSAILDYSINVRSSIGICGAYQHFLENPAMGDITLWAFTEKISRLNVALRYLRHLSSKPNVDKYIGIRMGLSYWTYYEYQTPGYYPVSPTTAWTSKAFSIQFLYGYRRYFSKYIGFHFEAGIGTPYLIEGGLTFRINTQKA
ncbi:MAG: hypothetical protein ACLQQ4_19430 [Bacteroidia bacterium]